MKYSLYVNPQTTGPENDLTVINNCVEQIRFAEDTGFSYHVVKPSQRQGFAHRHDKAEEVYVVVGGSGRINLDGEVLRPPPPGEGEGTRAIRALNERIASDERVVALLLPLRDGLTIVRRA